jgi:hypothetical protein
LCSCWLASCWDLPSTAWQAPSQMCKDSFAIMFAQLTCYNRLILFVDDFGIGKSECSSSLERSANADHF